MTNYEKFQNMTVEELATKFDEFSTIICYSFDTCEYCPFRFILHNHIPCDKEGFIEWLESEAKQNAESNKK